MSVSGVGINNYGKSVNFQGNQSKPVVDAPKSDKKMSTGMKIGLGATAVAATVIAGIAIKNKAAAKKALKALEKRANDLGLTTETLKNLERGHFKVEKCGKMGMSDVLSRIDDVAENSSSGIINVSLLSPKMLKESYKLKDVPENSFAMVYQLDNGKYRLSYLVHDGMDKSLAEVVSPAWEKDKRFTIPVE